MSNPKEVLKSKVTESGIQELTIAGKKGYSYLRHCIGVLKKHDSEGFSEYSDIKDNKDSEGSKNKTNESRKAAYTFATKKAALFATKGLFDHARAYIEVVSADDHKIIADLSNNQGQYQGDIKAITIAGALASEGYNRSFREDQTPKYSPKFELKHGPLGNDGQNLEEEEEEEVFYCPECGETFDCDDDAEECCADED